MTSVEQPFDSDNQPGGKPKSRNPNEYRVPRTSSGPSNPNPRDTLPNPASQQQAEPGAVIRNGRNEPNAARWSEDRHPAEEEVETERHARLPGNRRREEESIYKKLVICLVASIILLVLIWWWFLRPMQPLEKIPDFPLAFIPPVDSYNELLMNVEEKTGKREKLTELFTGMKLLMQDLILLLTGSEFKDADKLIKKLELIKESSISAQDHLFKLMAQLKLFKLNYESILKVIIGNMKQYFKNRVDLTTVYEVNIKASQDEIELLLSSSTLCLYDFKEMDKVFFSILKDVQVDNTVKGEEIFLMASPFWDNLKDVKRAESKNTDLSDRRKLIFIAFEQLCRDFSAFLDKITANLKGLNANLERHGDRIPMLPLIEGEIHSQVTSLSDGLESLLYPQIAYVVDGKKNDNTIDEKRSKEL